MTPKRTFRVLIVDDDDELRQTVAAVLEADGLVVVEASNGACGLQLMIEGEFDLVLLDHRLPALSGAEVVEHARAHAIATPIVMITAADSIQRIARDVGTGLWLGKPFGVDQLREIVARAGGPPIEA